MRRAASGPPQYLFRLFVAAETHNSAQAMGNLAAFCRERLPGNHRIDVVDVFREPRRALEAGIFMTPALVRMAPAPEVRVIGTLSNLAMLMHLLGPDQRGA